jgi:hypothetical protein
VQRALAHAEQQRGWRERQVAGVAARGSLEHAEQQLAWWTAELDRLNNRLQQLLAADDTTP